MSTRILVVDDTALFRRVLSQALTGIGGVEIAGSASNGALALARLDSLRPDLLTLDLEMPEMGGLAVLEALKKMGSPVGVIVLSAHTMRGSAMTIRALELGAFDFLPKPEGASPEACMAQLRAGLQPMIRAFERRQEIRRILSGSLRSGASSVAPDGAGATPISSGPAPISLVPFSPSLGLSPPAGATRLPLRTGDPIVLIGVSTGGPAALAQIIPLLPAELKAPIFIVQHMPPLFTAALAQSLSAKSALPVREAQEGETAQHGCVYLAPGGRHMRLAGGGKGQIVIHLTDDPPENNCRPSVDYLFRSAALHFPGRAIAAILTGMGNDGAQGLKLLKRGGCYTMAQDEASCVVFGMPREAIAAGVVDAVLPLARIAPEIVRAVAETPP